MKNPYGELEDGTMITASKAERGLSCNCICPSCGWKLEAHQGEKNIDYFSHYRGSDCGFGYESALHKLAKQILLEEKKILLPELRVFSEKLIPTPKEGYFPESKVIVEAWKILKLDDVILEQRLGRIIPDVLIKIGNTELLVEIKVTHGIDDAKKAYIKDNNLNVIEFDFSKARNIITNEDVKRVMTISYKGAKRGFGKSEWINHYRMSDTIKELTAEFKRKYLATQIPFSF